MYPSYVFPPAKILAQRVCISSSLILPTISKNSYTNRNHTYHFHQFYFDSHALTPGQPIQQLVKN